jgi:uncharacterized protein
MASSRLSSFSVLVLIAGLGMACGLLGLDEEEASPIPVPAPAPEPVKRTPNPGFACAKARSWSSKTVCTDADLADLDREMNGVYKARRKRMNEGQRNLFRDWQKEWKRNQRDLCEYRPGRKSQIVCLKSAHRAQIEAIKRY